MKPFFAEFLGLLGTISLVTVTILSGLAAVLALIPLMASIVFSDLDLVSLRIVVIFVFSVVLFIIGLTGILYIKHRRIV